MKAVIVGLGYVGLPLAVRAAEAGHDVLGVDVDPKKIASLLDGRTYIEDISDERLAAALATGRFRASGRIREGTEYDIGVITVPTPLRNGNPDLSYVHQAGIMLGTHLKPGGTVVLESTTYPGTTEGLLAETLTEASGLPLTAFHLGFSPERIDPGSKQYTLENTPKLVSATTPAGLEIVKGFYDTIVQTTVPVTSPKVAEMTKLFENIQAYVLIGLINEVSDLCHDLGIDVWEMIDASMTKGHSMSRWTPGPGVGGHCLPIDGMYLAWQAREQLGTKFRFMELAHEVNHYRPGYVVDRVTDLLNEQGKPTRNSKVLILGTAYKPNVGDTRESPVFPLIEGLKHYGADVTVCDPHVTQWDDALAPTIDMASLPSHLPQFDLVIVVTNHDEFDYDKIAADAQLVLDCRNAMTPGLNVVAL